MMEGITQEKHFRRFVSTAFPYSEHTPPNLPPSSSPTHSLRYGVGANNATSIFRYLNIGNKKM